MVSLEAERETPSAWYNAPGRISKAYERSCVHLLGSYYAPGKLPHNQVTEIAFIPKRKLVYVLYL